jgi:hypothetical protein
MKTTQFIKGAFIALIAFTLGSTAAQAQATRTWVSGVGDDLNPCSRTAPCKTFAGAISKTFINGEINVIDPGGFGTVTITKSITIDGSGGPHASILASGTNGVNINIAANLNDPQRTVTLRNLSINGTGASGAVGTHTGIIGVNINTNGADEVNIENCVIFNFLQLGVKIAPTSTCRVNIKNCIIRDCDGGAVQATPGGGNSAIVNISKSSMNASKFGFRADDNVKAVLDDCVLAGNANNGAFTNNSGGLATKLMVGRCTINDTGGFGVLSSGATSSVFINNNMIFNNVTGVGTAGGVLTSLGNNNINGNTTDGSPKP